MGLIKFLLKLIKCNSQCSFNVQEFQDNNLDKVDLSQYILKNKDMIAINKIVKKRASVNVYLHKQITQI